MSREKPRKLNLAKETLRRLDERHLRTVAAATTVQCDTSAQGQCLFTSRWVCQ